MALKNWLRRRVSLVAGQAQEYAPRVRSTNALYIINNTGATIHVAPGRDVDTNPEVRVSPNSNAPVPLSAPGESMYLYSQSQVDITVVEITTDDLSLVFAMQVIVSDISTAVDVSDRAGREAGKVGLKVAGADVATGNPVPTKDVGSSFAASGTQAANTQVQVTIGAAAGQRHRIKSVHFGWSGAVPATPVQATISDGVTTLRFGVGIYEGVSHTFGKGWAAATGAAVTLILPAGGAGVVGNITVEYETY